MALVDNTVVNRGGIRPPLFGLEKEAPVSSEPMEVWVPMPAFDTLKLSGSERPESLFIKGDRARKIADGYNDVVEH
jgi:hypothetical protein